jgi:peptide chain release factor 3
VFFPAGQVHSEPIFGAVGELQFEVAKYRIESEYGVKTAFMHLPFRIVRRVLGEADALASASWPSNAKLVEDWAGKSIVLFESEWSVGLAREWNPRLTFVDFDEQADAGASLEVVS